MVKVTPTAQNFTRGQLSRKMRGRYDLDFYYAGVERQENFISDVQGSATFRLGTTFLGETYNNQKAYFKEFIFAQDESYALEFTNLRLRAWTADGLVVSVDLATPYLEADLPFLQVAQSADTMYIAHRDYPPKELVRTGANTFTLSNHVPTGLTLGVDDYPACVAIYERRLMYAGSNNNPQTVFMSNSFLYDDFTIGDLDDEGIEYKLGSERLNRILWMSPTSTRCVVGTSGGSFDMSSGSTTEPITPTSVTITSTSSQGVSGLQPVKRDNNVIYIGSGARNVFSYEYVFQSDGFNSIDRTVLSDDITESGVSTVSFSQGNPDRVNCVLNNGKIALLVWKPEQQVFAWNQQTTDGTYTSVASLPKEVGSDDILYAVTRTIDGVEKNYVEVRAPEYELPQREDYYTGDRGADDLSWELDSYEAQKEYVYTDCSLTFNGLDRGIGASAVISLTVAAEGAVSDVTASTPLFTANDVGGQIRARNGEGWGTIITYTSATEVTVRVNTVYDETTYAAGDYYLTADTITGLAHLEGEVVNVIVDGAANEQRTVSGGEITLSDDGRRQGSVVHVGMPYTGVIKTMNWEGGSQNGSSQSKRKVLKRTNVLFLDSLGAAIGSDVYHTESLLFQSTGNRTNRPPLPFSGFKPVNFKSTTEKSKHIIVLQQRPLPCIIQLIQPELNTSNQ